MREPLTKKAEKQLVEETREAEYQKLRKIADKFLNTLRESVNSYVNLHDIEGLDRLVTQLHMVQDHALLQILRDKGLEKEITALCDKAGARMKVEVDTRMLSEIPVHYNIVAFDKDWKRKGIVDPSIRDGVVWTDLPSAVSFIKVNKPEGEYWFIEALFK